MPCSRPASYIKWRQPRPTATSRFRGFPSTNWEQLTREPGLSLVCIAFSTSKVQRPMQRSIISRSGAHVSRTRIPGESVSAISTLLIWKPLSDSEFLSQWHINSALPPEKPTNRARTSSVEVWRPGVSFTYPQMRFNVEAETMPAPDSPIISDSSSKSRGVLTRNFTLLSTAWRRISIYALASACAGLLQFEFSNLTKY